MLSKFKAKLLCNRRSYSHVPVMADEITRILRPDDGKVYIDMTFGDGGHSRHLLKSNKSIKIIAVDCDPRAYAQAQDLASQVAFNSRKMGVNQSVIPIQGKFSQVMKHIHLNGISHGSVHGVLFDLGASRSQCEDEKRGFTISKLDGPLDMRMDTSRQSDINAEDVVNNLCMEDLAQIFRTYGEERKSRKKANAIIDARLLMGRIKTTHELARVIHSVSSDDLTNVSENFTHPATKVFQALRRFVNNELNELNYAIEKIREFLIPAKIDKKDGKNLIHDPSGVAVVISSCSLEDKIVKRHFVGVDANEPVINRLSQHDRIRTNIPEDNPRLENTKKWHNLYKHVQLASEEEIAINPRSRSAKLRAAVRIT